ncbi:MAG: hypothetical protein KDA75_09070, partial [Planctomycetaceae bacterium]|nr:hypothetical protein [Planctomycetaceae bacterium]
MKSPQSLPSIRGLANPTQTPVPALPPLPIDEVLPRIVGGLEDSGLVVLRAPTGAGKTTRVPPAILHAGLVDQPTPRRIMMLEPRRLAAR